VTARATWRRLEPGASVNVIGPLRSDRPAPREAIRGRDRTIADLPRSSRRTRPWAGPVENDDVAPLVVDQPSPVQGTRRLGHAGPAATKHEGHEFVDDEERVCMGAIPGRQQPAGKLRLDDVKARARCSLRELAQTDENVAVDFALQRLAASELSATARDVHHALAQRRHQARAKSGTCLRSRPDPLRAWRNARSA
jgi:hypothetical protein